MDATDQNCYYAALETFDSTQKELEENGIDTSDCQTIAELIVKYKNYYQGYYQQILSDIYDAIVSRGLIFPKENIDDYDDQIRRLKKVDLDIQLHEALAMTEITERVLLMERLKDSVQSSLQVPEKYGLSDALDELCVSAGGNVEIIESLQVSLQTE